MRLTASPTMTAKIIMETKITMKRKSILRSSNISLILTDASSSTTRKIAITEKRAPDVKPIQKLIVTPCPKVIVPSFLFLKYECAKKINAALVNVIMEINAKIHRGINTQSPRQLIFKKTKAENKTSETTPSTMP